MMPHKDQIRIQLVLPVDPSKGAFTLQILHEVGSQVRMLEQWVGAPEDHYRWLHAEIEVLAQMRRLQKWCGEYTSTLF